MNNLEKWKAWEIAKETSKKIAGGKVPSAADQLCFNAQQWLATTNFYRCRTGYDCFAGRYRDFALSC